MKYREVTIGFGGLALAAAVTYAGSAQSMPSQAPSDATFVQAIQMGNDEEIAEARYMLGMTKNPQIRAFATLMISDHSSANVALLKAARNAHVPVPQGMRVADRDAAPDALRGLAGKQLETAYMAGQIASHTTMLAMVKAEEASGGDPSLKAYAAVLEPTVQKHLDDAGNIVNVGTQATPSSGGPSTGSPAPIATSTASSPLPPANAAVPTAVPSSPVSGSSPPAAVPPTHAP